MIIRTFSIENANLQPPPVVTTKLGGTPFNHVRWKKLPSGTLFHHVPWKKILGGTPFHHVRREKICAKSQAYSSTTYRSLKLITADRVYLGFRTKDLGTCKINEK